MDGDIGVAAQLGAEAEQCLTTLARRMLLHEIKLSALVTREEDARREEAELTREIKLLKDMETAYTREAAAAQEELSEKSCLFQELTRCASERLATRALQLETAKLEALTQKLRAREQELDPDGRLLEDEASVQALLLEVENLDRRLKKVSADHEEVRALSELALQEAWDSAVFRQQDTEEDEHCRLLDEAVEDMTLLLVDAELSSGARGEVAGAAGGCGDVALENEATLEVERLLNGAESICTKVEARDSLFVFRREMSFTNIHFQCHESTQVALARLSLLRDEYDMQFCRLQDVLRTRVENNRALALELGLVDPVEDVNGPDSTTSERSNSQGSAACGTSASLEYQQARLVAESTESNPSSTTGAEAALSSDEQKQNENVNRAAEIVTD